MSIRSSRSTRSHASDPKKYVEKIRELKSALEASEAENRKIIAEREAFGDGEANASQLNALQAMHAKKTRSLMKSISSLREELEKLKASTKDHRRTAMIQGIKSQVKAAELKVDVLKQLCNERLSMSL